MFKKILYFGITLMLTIQNQLVKAQYTIDQKHHEYKPSNLPSSAFGHDATKISLIIGELIVVLLQLSGGLAIFFIVFAGFKYVTSQGAQEKIDEAKKSLTWSILGLFVIILSYAIVENVLKIIFDVPPATE